MPGFTRPQPFASWPLMIRGAAEARQIADRSRRLLICSLLMAGLSGCSLLQGFSVPDPAVPDPPAASSTADGAAAQRPTFGLLYTAWIKPEQKIATVKIRLSRNPELVYRMRFFIDPDRYSGFLSSGDLLVEGKEVLWTPPAEDAWLQFDVDLLSRRRNGRYDGYISDAWALFRADDLVPPVRTVMEDGAHAKAKLELKLPDGWSVSTRYPRYTSGRYNIDDPDRRVDRPTGAEITTLVWPISSRRVPILPITSQPVGQGVKRMDMLAFLRWTIPTMQEIFPQFPERLLIVSAGKPMWRGALSAPNSLYLHVDRPMISGNGTSTLIHELVHVAMSARGGPKADWIVEGLAEFYSLEVLHRSGSLSSERYQAAHRELAKWGTEAETLEVERSHGPITAKAVARLRQIDQEIRLRSNGQRSLDDVVRALAQEKGPITRERFEVLVQQMQLQS